MEQTKRRPGRPPVERRRIQMAMRVTPELRDELVARAEAKGRSITQEMEMLLEQALLTEKMMGGKAWQVAVDILAQFHSVTHVAPGEPPESLDEPTIYLLAAICGIETIAKHFPKEQPADYTRENYILSAIDVARQRVEESFSKEGAE